MKKLLLICFTLLLLIFPSTGVAQGIVIEYDGLVSVLSGFHGGPDADYWKKLDYESTKAALVTISDDETQNTIVRSRALLALVHFPSQSTADHLSSVTASSRIAYMRASALDAYSQLNDGKIGVIKAALSDDAVIVRLQAVRTLSAMGGSDARLALEEAKGKEKNKTALSVIETALSQPE